MLPVCVLANILEEGSVPLDISFSSDLTQLLISSNDGSVFLVELSGLFDPV